MFATPAYAQAAGGAPGAIESMLLQFLPTSIIQIGLAIIVFNLWKRLKMNPWPVTILTAVPIVGMFVFVYVQLRALFILANRLAALEEKSPEVSSK